MTAELQQERCRDVLFSCQNTLQVVG